MLARAITASLLILLAGGVGRAAVHEDAVLKSPQSAVAAGGLLTLEGTDFAGGETYLLKLVGALREYELREVEASPAGAFSLEIEIPETVKAGQYKLTAIAPDGDAVASLDLTILEVGPAATTGTGVATADAAERAHGGEGDQMAQAADLPIERSRSGAEWGVIGLLIGLASGLGVSLIRRA